MLDIHAPHETVHSWRDFFIHIATIVVGLIIAVGLEQSVEFFHHRHQLHQFQADIRAEAQLNIRIIDQSLAITVAQDAWLAHIEEAAAGAPISNGFVTVTVPVRPPTPAHDFGNNPYGTAPSRGVWTVAQSTGVVELLPKEQGQIYNRLDREAAECLRIDGLTDTERSGYADLLRRLNIKLETGAILHLSAAQRDEFVDGLGRYVALARWDDIRFAYWKGASEAVIQNVKSMAEMFPYMNRATNEVPPL